MRTFWIGSKGRIAWLSASLLFVAGVCGIAAAQQPPQQKKQAQQQGVPDEAVAAKAKQARDFMAAGRFDEAIPICQELVKAIPGNPGLVLNLALAQHMAGREREAIANFEIVLKAQPDALPALLSLGAARLSLNESAQAIAPLQKAVTLQPNNTDARGMLATALLDAKKHIEAAEQYRILSEKTPDDPRAWYGLGMSYQSLSTAAFEQMQKLDPKSPWVLALVADSRVQRRQFRSAFFFYNETLKQLPNLHGTHAAMAEIYRKTGHPEWAADEDAKERALPAADCVAHPLECRFVGGKDVEILTAKLPVKPSPEAFYWRTKAANELAFQAFFRLGQLPESIEIHQLRAEIARSAGRPTEAVEEWRAALKLSPGNPRAMQELAVSLFMARDYRAAFEEASGLLKIMPQAPEMNFIAGDSLVRLEEPEKAEKYLRAALAVDPKMAAASASLGLALSRLGRNQEAVPLLERSLELDDDGSLYYQLSRAYQAAGQAEKAKATLARYQEILDRIAKAKDEVAREAQIGPPQK